MHLLRVSNNKTRVIWSEIHLLTISIRFPLVGCYLLPRLLSMCQTTITPVPLVSTSTTTRDSRSNMLIKTKRYHFDLHIITWNLSVWTVSTARQFGTILFISTTKYAHKLSTFFNIPYKSFWIILFKITVYNFRVFFSKPHY